MVAALLREFNYLYKVSVYQIKFDGSQASCPIGTTLIHVHDNAFKKMKHVEKYGSYYVVQKIQLLTNYVIVIIFNLFHDYNSN